MKTITVNLSDEDCERLTRYLDANKLTVQGLFNVFFTALGVYESRVAAKPPTRLSVVKKDGT